MHVANFFHKEIPSSQLQCVKTFERGARKQNAARDRNKTKKAPNQKNNPNYFVASSLTQVRGEQCVNHRISTISSVATCVNSRSVQLCL